MNIQQTRKCQRGVSAWTMIGSLLVVAGLAGLGVALTKPGGKALASASVANERAAASPLTGGAKPTATGTASVAGTKTDHSGSGPYPNWHGTWRSASPNAEMVITATQVGACKWTDATEPRLDAGCEAGYARSSVSPADISRRFEESVAAFQRDPTDFTLSDPVQSRALIARIKPGNYRVIWMQDGSDCGLGDLIIDGDLILREVNCHYGHQISVFARVR